MASATFTDPDPTDTHICTVDYGDGSGAVAGTVGGATCTGPTHAYATYGTYPVTVAVTDSDGNTTSATADHTVVFALAGFFAPLDNPPMVNAVKAGSAVPVKFGLSGDKGLAILAAGSPVSRPVSCASSVPTGGAASTSTAGASGLQYDPATATYTYVWKTVKAWAGTCRELSVTLVDGTTHTALFVFRK